MRVSGDVNAETINGEITITDARANNAEATTVNGDVRYTGSISDTGLYRFTTHQGDILMGVPDRLNATVSVRTYQGEFRSTLGVSVGEMRRGRRQTFTVGGGTAQIELESFGGEILLRRISEIPAPREKREEEDEEDRLDGDLAGLPEPPFGRPPAV
jgi:DUF4097 and DUF4098 domain-containing protein YvlB